MGIAIRRIGELISLLDRVAEGIKLFRALNLPISKRIASGRFYTVVPNIIFPIAIKKDNDLISRSSIEPSTIVYIHENHAFISSSVSSYKAVEYGGVALNEYVPGISIASNDLELILLASSIAEKASRDNISKIIKTLPNNLRALVERSIELHRSMATDSKELGYLVSRLGKMFENRKSGAVEVVLWTTRSRDLDLPYEISYVKSLGSGYLRLRYIGGEVTVRVFTSYMADTFIPKILPLNVVDKIGENVVRASKILSVAISMALEELDMD